MLTWLAVFGTLFLTMGLARLVRAIHRPGLFSTIRNLMVGVALLSVGTLCVGLRLALRSFEAFASSRLVAEVHCRWVGHQAFELSFTPVRDGRLQTPQLLSLRGDQWVLGGGIVKWHPWLTALGLPSYHKLTRVSGRFANVQEEVTAPPTAVELNGGVDQIWWTFYRLTPILPFVEATYGSAAFTYVNPAVVHDIYVTPSGYLIKRQPPASRHD